MSEFMVSKRPDMAVRLFWKGDTERRDLEKFRQSHGLCRIRTRISSSVKTATPVVRSSSQKIIAKSLSEYREYPHILQDETKILRPRTLKSVHFVAEINKIKNTKNAVSTFNRIQTSIITPLLHPMNADDDHNTSIYSVNMEVINKIQLFARNNRVPEVYFSCKSTNYCLNLKNHLYDCFESDAKSWNYTICGNTSNPKVEHVLRRLSPPDRCQNGQFTLAESCFSYQWNVPTTSDTAATSDHPSASHHPSTCDSATYSSTYFTASNVTTGDVTAGYVTTGDITASNVTTSDNTAGDDTAGNIPVDTKTNGSSIHTPANNTASNTPANSHANGTANDTLNNSKTNRAPHCPSSHCCSSHSTANSPAHHQADCASDNAPDHRDTDTTADNSTGNSTATPTTNSYDSTPNSAKHGHHTADSGHDSHNDHNTADRDHASHCFDHDSDDETSDQTSNDHDNDNGHLDLPILVHMVSKLHRWSLWREDCETLRHPHLDWPLIRSDQCLLFNLRGKDCAGAWQGLRKMKMRIPLAVLVCLVGVCVGSPTPTPLDKNAWALLVAGSKGFWNYRHQDVSSSNFLNILTGNAEAMKDIGTGRVIESINFQGRKTADRLLDELVTIATAAKPHLRATVLEDHLPLDKSIFPCYKELLENFNNHCFSHAMQTTIGTGVKQRNTTPCGLHQGLEVALGCQLNVTIKIACMSVEWNKQLQQFIQWIWRTTRWRLVQMGSRFQKERVQAKKLENERILGFVPSAEFAHKEFWDAWNYDCHRPLERRAYRLLEFRQRFTDGSLRNRKKLLKQIIIIMGDQEEDEVGESDARLLFLFQYLSKSMKFKVDKWHKMMATEESR
ncbi:unnamed protein product, partial [Nesidiocoris tenuis]